MYIYIYTYIYIHTHTFTPHACIFTYIYVNIYMELLFREKVGVRRNPRLDIYVFQYVWVCMSRRVPATMWRYRCGTVQWVALSYSELQCVAVGCNGLQWVAVGCSGLQCAASWCSVSQWVAVSRSLCVCVSCSHCVCVGGGASPLDWGRLLL